MTSPKGAARGPWLVSQVMWANVMRYVDAAGVRVDELHARARTERDSLAGLRRWGYVTFDPPPAGSQKAPALDAVVRPTASGRKAQELWRPLAGAIEDRWRERFGMDRIYALRRSLCSLLGRMDVELPDYLPVVYPTQNGKAEIPATRPSPAGGGGGALTTTSLVAVTDIERNPPFTTNVVTVLPKGSGYCDHETGTGSTVMSCMMQRWWSPERGRRCASL